MTEQELKQEINECERQIVSACNDLMSAARDVGLSGCRAAQSAHQSAISEVSHNKKKNTLLPVIISVGIFIVFGAALSWFLNLVVLIGGIAIAYKLNQEAAEELKSVQSSYGQMVSVAENQQRTLYSELDRTENWIVQRTQDFIEEATANRKKGFVTEEVVADPDWQEAESDETEEYYIDIACPYCHEELSYTNWQIKEDELICPVCNGQFVYDVWMKI